MKQAKLKMLAGTAALLVAVFSLLYLLYSPARLTQENFARIARGMSVQEVDAVLLGPTVQKLEPEGLPWLRYRFWKESDRSIAVLFVEEKVAWTDFVAGQSLIDKVSGWFGYPKEKPTHAFPSI